MTTEQHDGEAGEQQVLARDIGQARQDQLQRREQQPPFERDRRQRQMPQQSGQRTAGQCAAEMQAQRPAQQHRREGEQLAREQDRDQRRGDHQGDCGGCGPGGHVQRKQPEIGQRQHGGGHRRDVARHRRHDRHVLDDAQPVLAGETMLVRPGVEIGVAEIAHHQLVADLLAGQRDQPGERQAPDAAIDEVIGGDRHGVNGEEDQPEQGAARHHGEHGRQIEHAQREDRGAEHDQRDRRCGVTHHLVERGRPQTGKIIPCPCHADPPSPVRETSRDGQTRTVARGTGRYAARHPSRRQTRRDRRAA
jgi:hypothetical protein